MKLLRGHVISAAVRRGAEFAWGAEDRQAISAVVRSLTAAAPGAPRLLSAPDERLLLVLRDAVSGEEISAELRRRAAAGALQRTFTRRWLANVRREAPLRTNLNSLVFTAACRLHPPTAVPAAGPRLAPRRRPPDHRPAPASDSTDGRQPR